MRHHRVGTGAALLADWITRGIEPHRAWKARNYAKERTEYVTVHAMLATLGERHSIVIQREVAGLVQQQYAIIESQTEPLREMLHQLAPGSCAIVTSSQQTVLVYRHRDDSWWFMDSHGRDEHGLGTGNQSILRVTSDVNEISEHLYKLFTRPFGDCEYSASICTLRPELPAHTAPPALGHAPPAEAVITAALQLAALLMCEPGFVASAAPTSLSAALGAPYLKAFPLQQEQEQRGAELEVPVGGCALLRDQAGAPVRIVYRCRPETDADTPWWLIIELPGAAVTRSAQLPPAPPHWSVTRLVPHQREVTCSLARVAFAGSGSGKAYFAGDRKSIAAALLPSRLGELSIVTGEFLALPDAPLCVRYVGLFDVDCNFAAGKSGEAVALFEGDTARTYATSEQIKTEFASRLARATTPEERYVLACRCVPFRRVLQASEALCDAIRRAAPRTHARALCWFTGGRGVRVVILHELLWVRVSATESGLGDAILTHLLQRVREELLLPEDRAVLDQFVKSGSVDSTIYRANSGVKPDVQPHYLTRLWPCFVRDQRMETQRRDDALVSAICDVWRFVVNSIPPTWLSRIPIVTHQPRRALAQAQAGAAAAQAEAAEVTVTRQPPSAPSLPEHVQPIHNWALCVARERTPGVQARPAKYDAERRVLIIPLKTTACPVRPSQPHVQQHSYLCVNLRTGTYSERCHDAECKRKWPTRPIDKRLLDEWRRATELPSSPSSFGYKLVPQATLPPSPFDQEPELVEFRERTQRLPLGRPFQALFVTADNEAPPADAHARFSTWRPRQSESTGELIDTLRAGGAAALVMPMGGGKTEFIVQYIAYALPSTARVFFFTCRTSLAGAIHHRLEQLGFAFYLDHSRAELSKQARLVIQLDSAHKLADLLLQSPQLRVDLVVVDESEGLAAHHASHTMVGKQRSALYFRAIASRARQLLFCDAHYGETSDYMLRAVCNRPQARVFYCTQPPARRRLYHLFCGDNDREYALWREHIETAFVRDRKSIVVISNSNKHLKMLHNWVCRELTKEYALCHPGEDAPVIDIYNSDSSDADKRAAGGANDIWPRLRGLFFSPTITCGVDYSVESFHVMFVYAVGRGSCTAAELMQMTGRIRKLRPDDGRVCVYFQNADQARPPLPTSIEQILSDVAHKDELLAKLSMPPSLEVARSELVPAADGGDLVEQRAPPVPSVQELLLARTVRNRARSYNHFFGECVRLAQATGNADIFVVKTDDDDDDDDWSTKALELVKCDLNNARRDAEELAQAPDLDQRGFEEASQRIECNQASQLDRLAVSKVHIARLYVLPRPPSDVDFLDAWGGFERCEWFRHYKALHDGDLCSAIRESASRARGSEHPASALVALPTLQLYLVAVLLTVLGFDEPARDVPCESLDAVVNANINSVATASLDAIQRRLDEQSWGEFLVRKLYGLLRQAFQVAESITDREHSNNVDAAQLVIFADRVLSRYCGVRVRPAEEPGGGAKSGRKRAREPTRYVLSGMARLEMAELRYAGEYHRTPRTEAVPVQFYAKLLDLPTLSLEELVDGPLLCQLLQHSRLLPLELRKVMPPYTLERLRQRANPQEAFVQVVESAFDLVGLHERGSPLRAALACYAHLAPPLWTLHYVLGNRSLFRWANVTGVATPTALAPAARVPRPSSLLVESDHRGALGRREQRILEHRKRSRINRPAEREEALLCAFRRSDCAPTAANALLECLVAVVACTQPQATALPGTVVELLCRRVQHGGVGAVANARDELLRSLGAQQSPQDWLAAMRLDLTRCSMACTAACGSRHRYSTPIDAPLDASLAVSLAEEHVDPQGRCVLCNDGAVVTVKSRVTPEGPALVFDWQQRRPHAPSLTLRDAQGREYALVAVLVVAPLPHGFAAVTRLGQAWFTYDSGDGTLRPAPPPRNGPDNALLAFYAAPQQRRLP